MLGDGTSKEGEGYPPARALFPALLAIAMAASAAMILIVGSRLSFFQDDWALLFWRNELDLDAFLDPHNEHIALLPVAIYKLLLNLFGMGSTIPYRVVAVAIFLLASGLLFVYLRRRLGDWPALIGACLVLFIGAAWEDLIWSFQMGFTGSLAAGIAMLLALDRDDPKGDAIACGALTVSLAFSTAGLCFAAGAVVAVLLGDRPKPRRAYVAAVPLLLFALWWVGWGSEAESSMSLDNLLSTPEYVAGSIAIGFTSLLGLTSFGDPDSLLDFRFGFVLVAAVLALGALRVKRLGWPSKALLVTLAIGLAFWVLSGLNQMPGRTFSASRYQLPSAIFLLLILADLFKGVRIPVRYLSVASVFCLGAMAMGVVYLHGGYERVFLPTSQKTEARMAALDLAGDRADPSSGIGIDGADEWVLSTAMYREGVEDYGSPAPEPEEVLGSSTLARLYFDVTLSGALELRLRPAAWPAGSRCRERGILSMRRPFRAGPGRLVLRNPDRASEVVSVGRYASPDGASLLDRLTPGAPVPIGELAPGRAMSLRLPADASRRPWTLGSDGRAPIQVCAVPG